MFYQTIPNDLQTWMSTLSNSGAWVLLATGIFAIIIVFSEGYCQGGFFHKKYDSSFDADLSRLLIIFIIFALVMGIIALISGILTIWLDQPLFRDICAKCGRSLGSFYIRVTSGYGYSFTIPTTKKCPNPFLNRFFRGNCSRHHNYFNYSFELAGLLAFTNQSQTCNGCIL